MKVEQAYNAARFTEGLAKREENGRNNNVVTVFGGGPNLRVGARRN